MRITPPSSTFYKRFIPCVILALLLFAVFIIKPSPKPPSPIIIDEPDTPLSDKIQFKASFYLFDPDHFAPNFSNVTPDLAEYVGEGIVYFNDDIYNNLDAITPLIVHQPDYSSMLPSDKAIKWDSIYKYKENNEICVIGLRCNKGDVSYSDITTEEIIAAGTVKDFGATGDGVTDDTAAIKKAIAGSTDDKIYFPRGTYVISSTIYIPSNMQVLGEGKDSVIIAAPGTNSGTTMVMLNNADNVQLRNICISGNWLVNYENMNSKTGIHLLDIWNSDNVSVNNCTFCDNVNIAIRDVSSNNVTISDCLFKDVDCGFITMGSSDNIHDITIKNNRFDGHQSSEPISLFANAPHTNILIENNVMVNKRLGGGLLISGKQPNNKIVIRNNSFDGTASGMRIQNTTDVQVLHNSISNTSSGFGILIGNCNNVTLDDNTCTNVQLDGLQVSNSSNVTIKNLKTINCGQVNTNYFNIRFTGDSNTNISLSDCAVKYDNTTEKIGICFTCETDITMDNIDYSNATIWMTKTCANTSLSVPASVKIRDQGVDNSVTKLK